MEDPDESQEATAEELAAIQQHQLHTTCDDDGWTVLHYAAAAHKVKLVAQLLQLGGDPAAAGERHPLRPLHLACLGRVKSREQLQQLWSACTSFDKFQEYAIQSGPPCSALVQLLLEKGAQPGCRIKDSCLDLAPLHLLACWVWWASSASQEPKQDELGLAAASSSSSSSSRKGSSSSKQDSSQADEAAATAAARHGEAEQIQAVRMLLKAARDGAGSAAAAAAATAAAKDAARQLLNAADSLHGETPLTLAAYSGASLVAQELLAAGADVNLPRFKDAVRPLDIALAESHAHMGMLLLEHGAEVLPSDSYFAAYGNADEAPQAKLLPRMLLLNAVQMNEPDIAPRLVQALLAQKALLEEVWQESGETALLMAVADDDVELVRLLVAAGSNVEAVRQQPPYITALVDATTRGKTDIMQILLDAGADFASYVDEDTDYDLVQSAANAGQFEAVVKLVEAGASWRLARGQQRLMAGYCFYVPEILSLSKPGLKLKAIESPC
ncbi:hypothetical protein OEZ86_009173 [Tetradesmus obliquus]|nr:hypothetical protein OEZ86_009173 [Tetradesmus obliquus]